MDEFPVKIIFFYHKLDALRFFYDRLVLCAKQRGIDYLVVDILEPESYSTELIRNFVNNEPAIMFTMNQTGIGLMEGNENFWKKNSIPVYDFVQDHPRNYDDLLLDPMCDISVFSLDYNNISFIDRFYSKIKIKHFIPNGGTRVNGFKPFNSRSMDVFYMGGCQVETDYFPPINGLQDQGVSFYTDTIDMMIAQPDLTTEQAIDKYFTDRGYGISENSILKLNLSAAPYIENYVRRYFKLLGMHALDAAGIRVDIYGGDSWIDKNMPYSERITIHPRVSSMELNSLICNARISLCYTPWYKNGCSEKQFDSMLNGALCLSDKNDYLNINYHDGENIVYFDLSNPSQLAEDASWLLNHSDAAEKIAFEGYETALKYDTWEARFDSMISYIQEDFRAV